MTDWLATRPGRRSEWIGGGSPLVASAIRRAVCSAVPDGRSSFVDACSSTISQSGTWRAASTARRIISTAVIAKFGA